MNRSILGSILTIALVLATVGGATLAFFNSTATSSSNTFTTGSLSLQLDDENESATDGTVTGSITASNFMPGQTTTGFVSLHNAGSLGLAEVEMTADTSETADPGSDSNLADVLNLTVLLDDTTTPDNSCADGVNMTSTIEPMVGNGDGTLTLQEFDNGVDEFDAFPGLASGATRNVCFELEFDPDATNEYQGDAVSTTFTFTGNQNASQ